MPTFRQIALPVLVPAAFMATILLLDGPGLVRQASLGLATAGFLWLFCRRAGIAALPVLCCILVATTGEVILSLGWGLYSYQHAVIPLYVPPGHGLFYAFAVVTARQAALRPREGAIVRGVLVAGSAFALISLAVFGDVWGLVWWIGAAVLLVRSRDQLMLSACFAYTIVLELAGTANGNWEWAAIVPGLGLQSANPPAGVGILYILLDLIVVALTARMQRSVDAPPFVLAAELRGDALELLPPVTD